MEQYQWLANFGFAAVVAVFLLVRLEGLLKEMTKQIRLNTLVLARVTGQDLDSIRRDFEANGSGAI